MDIRHKKLRQSFNASLCLIACCCLSAAWADVEAPVDLPPPLDIAPPGVSLPDTLSLSGAMNTDNAPPAVMRFVTLGRVRFASNKWELSDAAKQTLDAIAAYLAAHPGTSRLLLDGHTDSVGGMKFNDQLSDKRATAVEAYLVSKGIDADLIRWKGHGEHAPADENWNRLGRDRNRQVELYAVYPSAP